MKGRKQSYILDLKFYPKNGNNLVNAPNRTLLSKKKLLDQKSKVYDLMGDLQRDNKTLTASILKEKWPVNGAISFVANQSLDSPMRRTHYS